MTQRQALAVLQSGCNVFLTGPAGSGKTHLLREFIADSRRRHKSVAVTASTGIAATHLDGITIHSWAGIGIADALSQQDIKSIVEIPRLARRLRTTDVLIIDEISMLHHFRLDLVSEVLRVARGSWLPFGGIQVILCGDFFQLPPVSQEDEAPGRFAYEAASWNNADFKICYLEEQFRQTDQVMTRILNDIRGMRVSPETKDILLARYRQPIVGISRPTYLFPHNENVDAVNERELAKLPGKTNIRLMTSRGKEKIVAALKRGCLAPETLALKQGARVMFVKNNFEEGYVNGTTGEIVGFEYDYPVVQTKNGRRIVARPLTWKLDDGTKIFAEISQIPLRLAWAITVHKSQGMSLDAATMDLTQTFVPGMGYVALSRIRTLDGLSLLGMNDLALEVSPEVHAVDERMKAASEAFSRTFVPKARPDVEQTSPPDRYAEIREKFPNAYCGWTVDEEMQLVQRFRSGLPVKTLANLHGRKRGSIQARLKKLGLIA